MKRLLYILICCLPVVGWGQVIETWAGDGLAGYNGDNGQAVNASIGYPGNGVFDKYGNYYFSIRTQSRVRKISPSGIITTFAGTGTAGFNGDNILAINAQLNNPMGLAVDDSSNVYIADMLNHRIRKVNVSSGIVTTYAGTGTNAFSGDNGPAVNASFWGPTDVSFDRNKNLYVCDRDNQRIRKIDSFNIVTTIAGSGAIGYNGDSLLALSAELNGPFAICIDSSGNIYISDGGNYRVRMVDVTNDSITNVSGGTGIGFYNGDNIPAIDAEIAPRGLDIDKSGNLYIGDLNQRVRKIDANGIIHTGYRSSGIQW